MKKKKHPSLKFKKKTLFNSRNFYKLFRRQFLQNYNSLNLISFVKRFYFFNLTSGYLMVSLLGFKHNMKLNFLKNTVKHGRIIRKMMILKFYFDYAFVKKQKFKILKTLVTFKSIRCYFSFPLRGQRTKTNAKTRKKYSII